MANFTLVLAFILICPCCVQGTVELNYGENCGDTIAAQCNKTQRLSCSHSNICDCGKWSVYSKEAEKCVSLIGELCYKYPYGNYIDCPHHASCTETSFRGVQLPSHVFKAIAELRSHYTPTTSVCQCNPGFSSTDNKTCILVPQYGEKCVSKKGKQTVCNAAGKLFCDLKTETCICRGTNTYDKDLHMCVKPLGANCTTPYEQCVSNAVCSHFLYGITYIDSHSNLAERLWNEGKGVDLRKNVCQCLPGYSSNSDGKCLGSFDAPCSQREHCNTERFLQCVNGACRCAQGAHTHYIMGKESMCMLQLNEACSKKDVDDGTSPACYPESECKKGKCVLKEEDDTPLVLLSYGKNCTYGDIERSCDNSVGLACIAHRTCGCFDSKFSWNSKAKRCVAKEGDKCGHFNLGDQKSIMFFHQLSPQPERNHSPSPDIPLYIACGHGLQCIFDPDENTSRCIKTK